MKEIAPDGYYLYSTFTELLPYDEVQGVGDGRFYGFANEFVRTGMCLGRTSKGGLTATRGRARGLYLPVNVICR